MNKIKKRSLKEISEAGSLALIVIIDNWKDYTPNTVLYSYAELRIRKHELNEKQNKSLNEFCTKHSQDNTDSFLDEVIGKNIDKKRIKKENENKYPALVSISFMYQILGVVSILVTLIVSIFLLENGAIFGLISIVVGAIVALGVFAVAEAIKVLMDIEHNTRTNTKK